MKKFNNIIHNNIGPNGSINYTPAFNLPKGFRACCHICNNLMFKTLNEIIKHNNDVHDIRKLKQI